VKPELVDVVHWLVGENKVVLDLCKDWEGSRSRRHHSEREFWWHI